LTCLASTRLLAALAFATLIGMLPAGCASSESGSRATLTEDGCAYEGDTAAEQGAFTIGVNNRTDRRGTFVIFRLADGHTMADVHADVDQAQREFDERGGFPPPPPGYFDQITYTAVKPDAASDLTAHLEAGTYFVMCFVDDLPVWRAFVTEQIDISD
jgi:hypothetical protein